MSSDHAVAHPPETAEGWYTLHQIYRIDLSKASLLAGAASDVFTFGGGDTSGGWSGAVRLIGSAGDVMFIHFRKTLDEIGEAQRGLARAPWMVALEPLYTFLSVTEAGLYRMTAELAKAAVARGGAVGDAEYLAGLDERRAKEIADPHVIRRLYPQRPAHMPYVCFYPMSKRRAVGQNWYALSLDERNRLMWEHGKTGRRYAGRVSQVISGSLGFDAWEWGVTLFAADPLEFKKIVTEMRFDEVSAQYAEFGPFYIGKFGDLANVLASQA